MMLFDLTEADLDKKPFLIPLFVDSRQNKETRWRYVFQYSTFTKWLIILINTLYVGFTLWMVTNGLRGLAGVDSAAEALWLGALIALLAVLGWTIFRALVILGINTVTGRGTSHVK